MNQHPINLGVLAETGDSAGRVNRVMVNRRAHEIALNAGRRSPQVTQPDYEQAKRELTGESDSDRQDALLDDLPKARRGDGLSARLPWASNPLTPGKDGFKHDASIT